MLEIQKFFKNAGTLRELRQNFHIRYVPCAPLRLVSLNCQILSPKNSPMVNECRSLYLNPDDWSVAFKSMNNFFDINSSISSSKSIQFRDNFFASLAENSDLPDPAGPATTINRLTLRLKI